MKKRMGFVSNSSSSSFIIKNEKEEKTFMDAFPQSKTITVQEIVGFLDSLKQIITDKCAENENICEFLWKINGMWFDSSDIELPDQLARVDRDKLDELLVENGNSCKLTEPVDRDDAYREYINLELFAGDI